jgi:tetratricopeptide (TPR) repeat protein
MIELITKLANSENKLDFCKNKISPAGEAEDILRLLILLREALSESDPSISGKLDFIIDRLRNSPTRKEMKQAVQILLGFVTPNFARLYLLLNAAQIAEREKNYDEALKYYNEILVLDSEYRVPYLWLQEIRDKIANLEKRIAN